MIPLTLKRNFMYFQSGCCVKIEYMVWVSEKKREKPVRRLGAIHGEMRVAQTGWERSGW